MTATGHAIDSLPAPGRVRVLIADDDPDTRLLLRLWLVRHGSFEVLEEAADGVEAVDAARRVRPELAVLDLAMPRMDGLETAAEIRRLLPHTRIVVRSGFSAARMAQKAIDAGADVYVEKAGDPTQLLAVLHGLFPGRDTGTAGDPGAVRTAPEAVGMSLEGGLLDALDVGVLMVDHRGGISAANFAATLALGVLTSHLVGSSLTDLLGGARHEDGRHVGAGRPDPVTEALASGRPRSGCVLQLDKPAGGTAWLSVNVRLVRGAAGSAATGAVVVVSDVTEERRLRRALRDADERWPRLLDAIGTPLAVLRRPQGGSNESAHYVLAHANPAASALTGWVVGSPVHHNEVSAVGGHVQSTGDDEVVVAWQSVGASTSGPPVQAVGRSDMWSETTKLLETAVLSSPVGVVLLDGSARLVIANPVADRLLGGSLLVGSGPPSRILRWPDTSEPVDDADLPLRAACQGTPFDDLELLVTEGDRSDGGTYVKISGRPVLGAHGPAGAVISVVDATTTKRAEQAFATIHDELQRSNTALADFVSVVSHDLSQPLQSITGFAELLREDGLDGARSHDYLDRIVVGCEWMEKLIRDLLTYSRITTEARPFEIVDLALVADEVVELFDQKISASGARIEVATLPTVVADRTQVRQLFQNLIGNALTYASSGVPPEIHVDSARGDGEWQITVADNGIGIDPDDRQRVLTMFERLTTSEEHSGTGIGLAVCVKVAERHGGRIWIDGNPGGGTRISVTLADQTPP